MKIYDPEEGTYFGMEPIVLGLLIGIAFPVVILTIVGVINISILGWDTLYWDWERWFGWLY